MDFLFLDFLYAKSLSETARTAIRDSLDAFPGKIGEFGSMFREIEGRMRLGETTEEAFRQGIAHAAIDREMRGRLMELQCGDAKLAIASMHLEVSSMRTERMGNFYSSLQNWLSVSVLACVILPSMALFAFIGYSMLYSSSAAFVAFSALLLSVFPVAFAALQRRIGGAYA